MPTADPIWSVGSDPAQARAYTLWAAVLDQDITQIVSQMLEDSPSGDLLRDMQPVFAVIAPQDRVDRVEMAGLHVRSAASPAPR
ncbi:hypothetical protein Y590_21435 [Methylobacterium sp. AMS5]|nr:hypothetical protein Y590_21435 [Methylobacterium sp. AMS5]